MIKDTARKLLWLISRLILKRYRPQVVAITGSAGKTSTKEAIFEVLSRKFKTRRSEKNLNTEFGLPLAIFGIQEAPLSALGWLRALLRGIFVLFFEFHYPEILVLEMGADKPGDIAFLTHQVKPNVAVVTALSDFPAHLEFFGSPKEVAAEKSNVVKALAENGWAVLNYDDPLIVKMKENTRARVVSFGLQASADIFASDILYLAQNQGLSFKLNYQGKSLPIRLKNIFSKGAVYACLAATGVGFYFGMNLLEISQALEKLQTYPGRLRLLKGIKNSLVLDDTYNASPAAMVLALETLRDIQAQRKIAVLGDMLELGQYSPEAHQWVGEKAGGICDYLLLFGSRAKFIQEGARHRGLNEENIFYFDNKQKLIDKLHELIKAGDLILVKASRGMHFEEIVESIMQDPEKKNELLVHCFCHYKPDFHRI